MRFVKSLTAFSQQHRPVSDHGLFGRAAEPAEIANAVPLPQAREVAAYWLADAQIGSGHASESGAPHIAALRFRAQAQFP